LVKSFGKRHTFPRWTHTDTHSPRFCYYHGAANSGGQDSPGFLIAQSDVGV